MTQGRPPKKPAARTRHPGHVLHAALTPREVRVLAARPAPEKKPPRRKPAK
jgi:hypothetical protein